MKNLALALLALAAVIVAVFVFSTNQRQSGDIIIPSQAPLPAEKIQFLNEGQQSTISTIENGNKILFPVLSKEAIKGTKARIRTDKGDVIIDFFGGSPLTVSNFIYLAKNKFYDGLTFHRREENFVIQGGDPKGDGTGGPSYTFADEPVTRDYKRGTVAMANAGPNTNGSQFFIMLADAPTLPKKYTIFGYVVQGMEVVDQIRIGDVMQMVTIE